MEAARLNPIYSKLCGLETRPQVIFDKRIVKDLVPRFGYTTGRVTRSWKWYGLAYNKANIIWLNPNLDIEECRKTLAHEFIHFRFPYLAHTKQFRLYVEKLLAGEQFKPYRPRTTRSH